MKELDLKFEVFFFSYRYNWLAKGFSITVNNVGATHALDSEIRVKIRKGRGGR